MQRHAALRLAEKGQEKQRGNLMPPSGTLASPQKSIII
jgi:hypothetical protein